MSQGSYVWIAGKKVYLNPELQKEWDKLINKERYRARQEKICGQADYRRCNGDCFVCPWRKEGIVVSYETQHFAQGFGNDNAARGYGVVICGSTLDETYIAEERYNMKIRLLCPENQYADGTEISTPCAENKSICGTKERAENGANAHFSAFAHRRRLENQHTQQQYNNSNTIDTLSHYSDEFEKLWFAYPANRRNDWDEAIRVYQQALRHGATLEIIMTALEAAKSSIAWTKDGGQYIPGISKWLQREPWREANLQKAQKENQEQWNSQ